jgi:ComF family protein
MEALTRTPVCDDCWRSMMPHAAGECATCGLFMEGAAADPGTQCGLCRADTFGFEQARCFGPYENALSAVIRLYKYRGIRPLAAPLAGLLAQTLERLDAETLDLVVPVPLHRNRERHRGFNQAALLAKNLARAANIALAGRDCVRVRDTQPQTGLSGAERRKNVRGAFAVPAPERIRGRRVLLVDDVMTTGATVDACARALLAAGAAGVWVVTLGRARLGASDGL